MFYLRNHNISARAATKANDFHYMGQGKRRVPTRLPLTSEYLLGLENGLKNQRNLDLCFQSHNE